MYHAHLRIIYPLKQGRLVLRTEQNWDKDVDASSVQEDGTMHEFQIDHDRPYLNFKPCIRDGSRLDWSAGTNKLLLLTKDEPSDFYPHFYGGSRGWITDLIEIPSAILSHHHRFRIYLPAGFDENQLKRYPVIYMHDGSNLFFPEEAFMGQEWRIDENLDLMDAMNLIDKTLIVGIHAADRFYEFTAPGYFEYGKALVNEIKPWVDQHLRTLPEAQHTSVMGSSLGGVVAFFLAWEWPAVFRNAACMSSTFSYRDDLIDRVRGESLSSREGLRFYLDSGWPEDNYEVTLSMACALLERKLVWGQNFVHFAFPLAAHNEGAWSARAHLPLQWFSGKLSRAAAL